MSRLANATWSNVTRIAVVAALSSIAADVQAQTPEPQCRPPMAPWTQVELYFGRGLADGAVIGEAAWRDFLAEVVTPLFPDGLTVVDAAGQWRGADGVVAREPTKLLIILVPDADAAGPAIEGIIASYKDRFDQESVLHAEQAVCVAF